MMKETNDNNGTPENPYKVFYDNYLDTNACTECTGLMPCAPENREEWNSFREIFDFTPEQLPRKKPGE